MLTVAIHCPDIAGVACVGGLIDVLISKQNRDALVSEQISPMIIYSEAHMLLVAHSPLSLTQGQVQTLLFLGPHTFFAHSM